MLADMEVAVLDEVGVRFEDLRSHTEDRMVTFESAQSALQAVTAGIGLRSATDLSWKYEVPARAWRLLSEEQATLVLKRLANLGPVQCKFSGCMNAYNGVSSIVRRP
jgi:hypothetical protein